MTKATDVSGFGEHPHAFTNRQCRDCILCRGLDSNKYTFMCDGQQSDHYQHIFGYKHSACERFSERKHF